MRTLTNTLFGALACCALYANLDAQTAGTYATYGTGCGSGIQDTVLPKGFAKTWGVSGNAFPWGFSNMHYMQAHASSEFANTTIVRGMAFRNRRGFAQYAYTVTATVNVGYTMNAATALNTTFASNWSGKPTTAFSGNINVAAFRAQTDPTIWTLQFPFKTPFIYIPSRGNFVWECLNTTASSVRANYFDRVSSATNPASRLYSTAGAGATTGTLGRNYCVVTRLLSGSSSSALALKNTGVPVINKGMSLDFSGGATNSVALMWLGATKLGIALGANAPGCSLYCTPDVLLAGLPTGATGSGSLPLMLPNDRTLVGIQFYNQCMVLDAPANAVGITFSNGGEAKIGG